MSLSCGQKQRAALDGAVASEREIIILDELTIGLDLFQIRQVAQALPCHCERSEAIHIENAKNKTEK
ncbi:MAG: hypothetical protein LBI78_04910 [Campylobacteraceae bacterium]|jgi:energy-coupling factor transporter ATP-binding protein EcfA2|nr:hypothetical protein [Campylobacteraceae bacterium]